MQKKSWNCPPELVISQFNNVLVHIFYLKYSSTELQIRNITDIFLSSLLFITAGFSLLVLSDIN